MNNTQTQVIITYYNEQHTNTQIIIPYYNEQHNNHYNML